MANGDLVIGLVCEGKRDQMALEAICDHLNTARRDGKRLAPQRIQPAYTDATRAKMKRGGDDKVRQWCQTLQDDRSRKIFRPAFVDPDNPPCDYVVILHDADQLGSMSGHAPSNPLPAQPWTAANRGAYVIGVLKKWLWPSSTPDPDAGRYLLHAAVQAIETWYVAAGDATIAAPEEDDPVPHMIRIWPDIEDPAKPGKLLKMGIDSKYQNFNIKMILELQHVRNTSPHFHSMVSTLENLG